MKTPMEPTEQYFPVVRLTMSSVKLIIGIDLSHSSAMLSLSRIKSFVFTR